MNNSFPANAALTPRPGSSDQVDSRRPLPYFSTGLCCNVSDGRRTSNSPQVEANCCLARGNNTGSGLYMGKNHG